MKKVEFRSTLGAAFLRWLLLGGATGAAAGAVGVLFHLALSWAEEQRLAFPWLLYLLPLGGALIAALYRYVARQPDKGTNLVLLAVRRYDPIPLCTGPLIFVSTAVTHLLGGSAGREGAALQLGGSVGSSLARLFRLEDKEGRILVMAGMSAAFAALFGTPVTAVVFVLEVTCVGVMYYAALLPCTVAALTGLLLARLAGVPPTAFRVAVPELGALVLLKTAGMGVLVALMSILFWWTMDHSAALFRRFVPAPLLRTAVGGALIVLLTLLVGTRDYNGAGMAVIIKALSGQARPWDFALKLLFTALTLGAGFKGGEIVPVFFVGAALGCAAGPLLGLPAGYGAALGLAGLFCGVTNCPVASILLAAELFGAQGLPGYCMVCAVSYLLSGYGGLYREQKILYSKVRVEYIGEAPKEA